MLLGLLRFRGASTSLPRSREVGTALDGAAGGDGAEDVDEGAGGLADGGRAARVRCALVDTHDDS